MVRKMLRALVGMHSLRRQAMGGGLWRCTLWTRLGMTVMRILSGARLVHGGVNIWIVHGRIGHVGKPIL